MSALTRIRPSPRPRFSAATTTIALLSVCRQLYTLFGAPDVRFIDLDDTVKPIKTGANHRESAVCATMSTQSGNSPVQAPAGDPTHSRRSFGW